MQYAIMKTVHILAVVLFLGNIITAVFWKLHGDFAGTLEARAQALDGVIKADRIFTLPSVALIVITGVWMALTLKISFLTTWILWALVLFGFSGACFSLFVGPLQKKLLANVRAGQAGNWNQAEYDRVSTAWKYWGLAATVTPLAVVFLMVAKPV